MCIRDSPLNYWTEAYSCTIYESGPCYNIDFKGGSRHNMIRESNTMEYANWLDKGPISYPISYFIHSDDQWNVWSNIMRLLLKLNFFLKLLLEQNYFISVICFTLHHINKAAWVCMSYNLLPLWICSNWIVIIKITKIPSPL